MRSEELTRGLGGESGIVMNPVPLWLKSCQMGLAPLPGALGHCSDGSLLEFHLVHSSLLPLFVTLNVYLCT